jgi:acetylornithine deacetylase
VQKAIEQRAEGARRLIDELDLEVSFDFAARGYRLDTDHPLAEQLGAICRHVGVPLRLDAFRSHSDGNLFFEAGVSPLILGPGSLECAHTSDEQIALDEVVAAARIYAALGLAAGELIL